MLLLAYIGRFFHGLAPQPGVETIASYAKIKRFFSRTDRGVNAVANPVEAERFYSDFAFTRGYAEGMPSRKEYHYYISMREKLEEFIALIPNRIDSRSLTSRPRKKYQELEIFITDEYVSFSASGFESYAIRRIIGYFLWRLKGKMSDKEVEDSLRGFRIIYPPNAPPEPLVLWRTDVEEDPYGEREAIEAFISSWAKLFSSIKLSSLKLLRN